MPEWGMRKFLSVLLMAPLLAGCVTHSNPVPPDTPMIAPASEMVGECEPPTDAVLTWIESRADYGGYYTPDDVAMVRVTSLDNDIWWLVALVAYSDAWGGGKQRNDASYLTNTPGYVWTYVGRPLGAEPGTTNWSGVDWPADLLEQGQTAQQRALSCTAKVPDYTPESAVRECLTVPDAVRGYFAGYLDTGTATPLAMMYATEGNNPGEKWWLIISGNLNTWLTNIPGEIRPSGDQLIENPSRTVQWPPEKRNYLDQLFWKVRDCPLS